MGKSGIHIAAIVGLALSSSAALAQRPFTDGSVKSLDQALVFTPMPPAAGVVWSGTVRQPGSPFIRLHFTEISDTSTVDYAVVIRNANNRVLQRLRKDQFRARGEFWTKMLEGGHARIEVVADAPPAGLKFSVREMVFQQPKAVLFSTVADALESIFPFKESFPQLYQAGSAVARLAFVVGGFSKTCTGFMIDDERMLTNHHCVATAAACATALAWFGYEVQDNGVNLGEQYDCLEVLEADATLDLAVLRIDEKPGSIWGRLELTRRAPSQNEPAFVVQHAGRHPKVVSRVQCQISTVIATPDTDLGHTCDTAEGSSGAPIMSTDLKVIGLHHQGFSPGSPMENFGVRMERIMDFLGIQ